MPFAATSTSPLVAATHVSAPGAWHKMTSEAGAGRADRREVRIDLDPLGHFLLELEAGVAEHLLEPDEAGGVQASCGSPTCS